MLFCFFIDLCLCCCCASSIQLCTSFNTAWMSMCVGEKKKKNEEKKEKHITLDVVNSMERKWNWSKMRIRLIDLFSSGIRIRISCAIKIVRAMRFVSMIKRVLCGQMWWSASHRIWVFGSEVFFFLSLLAKTGRDEPWPLSFDYLGGTSTFFVTL